MSHLTSELSQVVKSEKTTTAEDTNQLDNQTKESKVELIKSQSRKGSGTVRFADDATHRPIVTTPLSLTRELATRRKTIVESFCLVPKPDYENSPNRFNLYQQIVGERGQKRYAEGKEAYEQGDYETCLLFLRKALVMEPNNGQYYILRAEAYLQLCDFKAAILNYKRVCILWPEDEETFTRLAFLYFLQGQCLYDEEMYLDALECFTRASEMKPENKNYHSRSIACLASLKRHRECLSLINKRLLVDSSNPDMFILRARIHLLFNNSTLSYFDVKQALSLDPESTEAGTMQHNLESNAHVCREKAIQLHMDGKTKEAIAKISYAIDTNPDETEFHVLRASMHRRNCDFNASVDDLLLAMNKCDIGTDKELYERAQQQLLLTFNDFAVDCFNLTPAEIEGYQKCNSDNEADDGDHSHEWERPERNAFTLFEEFDDEADLKGFYEEAIILLEKAIKGEKDDSSLYCNRGDCFYKLGHLHFALLDYQQAEELSPTDSSIPLRLSVVYNELGILEYTDRKYYRAEDYFSLAICNNPRIGNYYLSRARARYMQENIDEAQVDIILALYLESVSKEVFSMFARLFSGKTVDEVMQSKFAALVLEALEDVIKCNSEEDCVEGITSNTTMNSDIYSVTVQRETPQQCMIDRDFHFNIIKGKKKVNELVESVIQSRQDLSYTGPVIAKMPNKNFSSNGKKLKQKIQQNEYLFG